MDLIGKNPSKLNSKLESDGSLLSLLSELKRKNLQDARIKIITKHTPSYKNCDAAVFDLLKVWEISAREIVIGCEARLGQHNSFNWKKWFSKIRFWKPKYKFQWQIVFIEIPKYNGACLVENQKCIWSFTGNFFEPKPQDTFIRITKEDEVIDALEYYSRLITT